MNQKLYIQRRLGLRRHEFWGSPQTTLTLNTLRAHYKALAGREVSTTVIVRRALELLSKRIGKAKPDSELRALLRHVR